ncbi:MAG: metallophosphatase family protein [Gammaproteobacteria bacterium]|nr:metallophosphatase family protein [Gammaproteobacteria bacterium]MBU1413990.1 metallophosphatase family protein [Gammaproteobacteria bacterium]
MRIAAVSDIHGNLPALEAVVKDIRRRGADLIVNLGDSLSGPLLPLETAQYLMAQDWPQLAGNHERQILDEGARTAADEFAFRQLGAGEIAWIASLRDRMALSAEVLLCHGTPTSDCDYLLETVERSGVRLASTEEISARLGGTKSRVLLCGHTHFPRSARAQGMLIVNPGSVGLPAFDDDYCHPHVIETGSPDARYALLEEVAGAWSAELITVPYPYRQMAELARSRGMKDWAYSLDSGYARIDQRY